MPNQNQSNEKYCMPVMFVHFFCALLSIRAREFPVKSKKNRHFSLTAGPLLRNLCTFDKCLHSMRSSHSVAVVSRFTRKIIVQSK